MTKEVFLKKLKNRLNSLEKTERQNIILEYSNKIDMKIKDGNKEEDVINNFGNIDDLANEILSTYKKHNKSSKSWLENIINRVTNWLVTLFHKFIKVVSDKKNEDTLYLIFKVIVILLFIWICKMPFMIIEHIGYLIFEIFPLGTGEALIEIWEFLVEAGYLIFAIIFLITAIKKLINNDESIKDKKVEKKKEHPKKEEMSSSINKEPIKNVENNNTKTAKTFLSPFLTMLKVFVVILTIPLALIIIALFLALGIMIVFLFNEIYLISLFFIVIGLIIISISTLLLIYRLLFGKGGR